jgi:hypothetical protein
MPLPFSQREDYTRINRIFVDSSERSQGTVSNYRYDLKDEIQEVVGIELTGYAIPTTLTPTFVPNLNDQFRFEIKSGLYTFTATSTFPSKSYTYENVENPYLSYIITLKQIMTDAIFNDPVFGNNGTNPVTFTVFADPETRTHINASGTGLTSFRFLFSNLENSAHTAMGYDKIDTSNNVSLTQISPRKVSLDPFPRLDIFIKEFPEVSPVDVIYNPSASYYGTTKNDTNVTRMRLLSSKPLKKLKWLNISLKINGIPIVNQPDNEHSLAFTILSIANEEKVPNWAKLQSLAL